MHSPPMSPVMSRARASCSLSDATGSSTRWVPISVEYVRSPTVLKHTEPMHTSKTPLATPLAQQMISTAYDEALTGLREGGIPIGAALFKRDGTPLGRSEEHTSE